MPAPAALPARLARARADIKQSHAVVALPFAVLAAVAARPESKPRS